MGMGVAGAAEVLLGPGDVVKLSVYGSPDLSLETRVSESGNITFPLLQRNVDDILTARDAELVECMRFFFTRMKLVVEPTGCLGLAAARRMKAQLQGQRIGVLISGGNVDLSRFCSLLGS